MHVFQGQDDRLGFSHAADQRLPGLVEALADLSRITTDPILRAKYQQEAVQQIRLIGEPFVQPRGEFRAHCLGRIGVKEAGLKPEDVEQRMVPDLSAERDAAAPQHHRLRHEVPHLGKKLAQQAALAYPRLTEDRDQVHAAFLSAAVVQVPKQAELSVPPNQRRRCPPHIGLLG